MIDISKIPSSPGCYLYKDESGKVLYVGKAKDLKKRVKNYFTKDVEAKTKMMLEAAKSLDFIATNTDVEALILENKLIKQHQPRYNINLKDAKTYAYIHLTGEPYPRLLIARKKDDSGKYYGPFVSAEERDRIIKLLRRLFKIRTCKKIPKKPCLKYHINTCSAPCINKISKDEYDNNMHLVSKVLSGNTKEIIAELERKILDYKKSKEYEKAIVLRDQLTALKYLDQHQNMDREKKYDEDVLNYKVSGDKVYLLVFNVNKGVLTSKAEYTFDYYPEFLEEFIVQYYSENEVPRELIVPEQLDGSMIKFLTEKRGSSFSAIVPKFGSKRELLDLAAKNIELLYFNAETKMTALQKRLGLNSLPSVIECFDVSHLSGTLVVGSMVYFKNGLPDKSNYRRFKLSVEGNDDTRAIKEIVARRYKRLKEENITMPDLIVIDGGRGQLNAAISALKELNLDLPVVSIAKEFEEVYSPYLNSPLRMDNKEEALKLLQSVRNEAHRFAVNYNKLLRGKRYKK